MTRRGLPGVPIGVALLLLTLAPSAWAGWISGTVVDQSTGLPISSVYVTASREASPTETVGYGDYTDADGHYLISELPTSDYTIGFSPGDYQNYVREYYDDKASELEADPVHVGKGEALRIDASLAVGGRITGRVVSAVGGIPLEGVWVCTYSRTSFDGGCTTSGSDGSYAVQGLRTDSYAVEFSPEWDLNYFGRWYDDAGTFHDATWIPVTQGSTTGGVDEDLLESAGVSGTLTDSFNGEPVAYVYVCAIEVGGEEFPRCSQSDAHGHYLVGGMSTGEYRIAFSPETSRDQADGQPYDDGYYAQYYEGASSREDALPLTLTAPGLRTGVDAQLAPEHPRPAYGVMGSGNIVSGAFGPAVRSRPATLPDTYLAGGPRIKYRSATFRFTSSPAGLGFQCRLDHRPFLPCASPTRYTELTYGRHRFEVRAVTAGGAIDPSPARVDAFFVKRPGGRYRGR